MTYNAYRQARKAFFHQPVFSKPERILLYSQIHEYTVSLEQPDLEQQLFSALITGNEELLDTSIEEWSKTLLDSPELTLDTVKKVIDHFNHLMEDWTKELTRQYLQLTIA